MAVYSETIDLKDNVSGTANKAAQSVNILQGAIVATENALVKAQATGNIKKYQSLSKDLDAYKSALSTIPPVQNELTTSTNSTTASTVAMQEEMAAMTGGLSLVAEAIGAVVVGFGLLVVAGAAFAIKASEAKNASISLFNALGQGKITGEEVDDMLDELRASTGLTKDSLAPLTSEFLKMGITGKDALVGLTTAAASAEALGKGGADAFTKLYEQANAAAETGSKLTIPYKKLDKQLHSMGLTTDDLASKMGMSGEALTKSLKAGTVDATKFGNALEFAVTEKGVGPMQTLANSSENLGKLLKEYIGDLFEDMGKDIAPFMAQIRSLFSIFDSKAPGSGQALKAGIGGFFKEVFALATKVVPYIKHFLLDLVILGLKAYIGLKPIIKWFGELQNNQSVMDALSLVISGLKTGFIVLAVAVGVVVGLFAGMIAITIAITAAVWAFVGSLVTLGMAISETLINLVSEAISFGSQFVDGLVKGITDGASKVVGAVSNLADSAKNTFKNALGIASPSKVGTQMGGFFGQGVAQGVEGESQSVTSASSTLASAAVGGSPSGGSSSGGSSGGVNVTVEAGAITIQGAGKSAEELTEQMVSVIFERIALEQGL